MDIRSGNAFLVIHVRSWAFIAARGVCGVFLGFSECPAPGFAYGVLSSLPDSWGEARVGRGRLYYTGVTSFGGVGGASSMEMVGRWGDAGVGGGTFREAIVARMRVGGWVHGGGRWWGCLGVGSHAGGA
jgi:hypothetical protein